MSFIQLSDAEVSILKGLIGFCSTSETIARGFIRFELKALEGRTFSQNWERLDYDQKQAIIDIYDICSLAKHDFEIGGSPTPTHENFVQCFYDRLHQIECNQLEIEWDEDNPKAHGEIPTEVRQAITRTVNAKLKRFM